MLSQIIERKMSFLKEYIGITEANPKIKLDALAALIDQRLENQEGEINKMKNVFG